MPDSNMQALPVFNLHEASQALGRCSAIGDAISCMEVAAGQIAGSDRFDIVWSPGDEPYSLRPSAPSLALPAAATEQALTAGRDVVERDQRFVPMLAGGFLQGWISLPADTAIDDAFLIWANQCGAALRLLDNRDAPRLEQSPAQHEEAERNRQLNLLYSEQQRVVDRLTALNALSLAVSTSELSADMVMNMAVAGAVGTTNAESGAAAVSLEGRPLAIYGSGPLIELPPEYLARGARDGADYVELSVHELPETIAQAGMTMALVMPLRGATLTVGAFWIAYGESTPSQAEREVAVLYAKMAGAVLENLYLDEVVRSAHDRMASVLGSTREGMLLIGGDRCVSIANRAFGEMLGFGEGQLHRKRLDELCRDGELGWPAEFRSNVCAAIMSVLDGQDQFAEGEATLAGGAERDVTWWVLPVPDVGADTTGALLVLRDVTAERAMERMRQDLSNMIVHDLRAPLTNIMVSVDLLLKQATGSLTEAQRRILAITSASCQQMLDLVNALLDIRRLQQRKVELERQPVYLEHLAETVIERLETTAENKRIHLEVGLEGLPPVVVDPDMIRRVLQNLVDNAVKFGRPDSLVEVMGLPVAGAELPGGHAAGRWLRVEVRDEGPGIPDEYLEPIFEVFAQAPSGYGRGTGLGLAFCKLAVEAHGGRIWVESVLERGSRFYFTLPLAF